MAAEDVTLGELHRSLQQLRDDLHEDFAAVHKRIEGLSFISSDRYEGDRSTERAERSALTGRVTKMEDANTWLVRVVAGQVLAAVVGGIILMLAGMPK